MSDIVTTRDVNFRASSVGEHNSYPPDQLWMPAENLREGIRYRKQSETGEELCCSSCNSLLGGRSTDKELRNCAQQEYLNRPICPLLLDWENSHFVSCGLSQMVTGVLLKWLLSEGFYNFYFGPAICERSGCSRAQAAEASRAAVPISQVLELVPGGAERNHEIAMSLL